MGPSINAEPNNITVPFVYDMTNNSLQVVNDRREPSFMPSPTSPQTVISNMLKSFLEMYNTGTNETFNFFKCC